MKTTPDAANAKIEPLETAEEINRIRAEFDAETERKKQELFARASKIYERQAPLDQMLTARRAVLERLAAARKQRAEYAALERELNLALEPLIYNGSGPMWTARFLNDHWPHAAIAGRMLLLIDNWLPLELAKVAALDAEIQAYAATHKLEHLVPN